MSHVDSTEVLEWMKELDGFDIPDLQPTTDGTCLSDPQFAADAASRGWWTCGGHIRDTGSCYYYTYLIKSVFFFFDFLLLLECF